MADPRPPGRRFGLVALFLAFAAGAAGFWAASSIWKPAPPGPAAALPVVELHDIAFADIPGWAADDHAAALAAFQKSCAALPDAARFPQFGDAEAWSRACAAAGTADTASARHFFETRFQPAAVSGTGKVTGYYEPELTGSRAKSAAFPAPVYARPADLVTADPEGFRALLHGERLAGKLENGTLKPYDTRAEIESGSLDGRADAIVYLPSTVDAFFLQIQGSGRVKLQEGGWLRLNYAAQNGHPYSAIGAALIAEGAIPREKMSMQAIRAWLAANPDRAAAVMNLNASYVFFRALALDDPALGPPGAEGVPLMPGRSLAVDSRLYPYGLPVFVTARGTGAGDIARLMIAQDTGGAIRGAVRGDIFFGWGVEAEAAAGVTNAEAAFVILRPK